MQCGPPNQNFGGAMAPVAPAAAPPMQYITISDEQNDAHNNKTVSTTGCSYQYQWQ